MAYGDRIERHGAGHGGGATTYAPPMHPEPRRTTGPCAPPASEPPSTCCDLVCFDRPRYFCGHLLTDADLSLEQRYVLEKQKLYHRTLHGTGIVCGLRLTCDPVCRGHVLVGEGFAIDDCGNDLVVCEPTSFDVIGRLREKKYLPAPVKPDPCKPAGTEPDCKIRQCFYVTACYREEPHEYTTPLTPGCGPSPRECEPTRVRETVVFDVVSELPATVGPLEELQKRIEKCFKLFTEGPFAAALKGSNTLNQALGGGAAAGQHQAYWDEFCKLRGLLLLYLDTHPDHYNCTIREDIVAIQFPDANDPGYGPAVANAFCRLINLANQHVQSCVFGELAFPCAEPTEASCVVLGTVEVEDDRVVRVCNCPRSYVWSFASFFQALMATVLGSLACETVEQTGHDTRLHAARGDHRNGCGCGKTQPATCCRQCKIEDCAAFVRTLAHNGYAISDLGTAILGAVKEVRESLQETFDPCRAEFVSKWSFIGKSVKDIVHLDNIRLADRQRFAANPLVTLERALLRTPETRFLLYQKNDVIVDAEPVSLADRVAGLEQELALLKSQLPPRDDADQTKPKGPRPPQSRRPKEGPA